MTEKRKRYDWQLKAYERHKNKKIGGLDVSCGCGKTLCLIDIAKYKGLPTIVIAPKAICSQWRGDLIAEGIMKKDIWVHEQQTMTKNKETYLNAFVSWLKNTDQKYLIVPTQNFSLNVKNKKKITVEDLPVVVQLFLGKFGRNIFGILDESSWIKSSTVTKNTQSIRSQAIIKLGSLIEHKQIATGTLMTKSPMNVYNQIAFLDKDFFIETPAEFFNKYTITRQYYYGNRRPITTALNKTDYEDIQKFLKGSLGLSKFNGGKNKGFDYHKVNSMSAKYNLSIPDVLRIAESDKYFPFRNLDKLQEDIAKVMFKVERKDVFDIGYDKFVYDPIVRTVELTEEQKSVYTKIVKDGFTDTFYLGKAQALELLIRCQDICNGYEPLKDDAGNVTHQVFKENPKLDTLIELLDEIDSEEQVVIWSSRILMVDAIVERLIKEDISYTVYTGGQDKDEKAEAEKLFAEKKVRCFVANPAAAGFGLNVLRDCNYMVWCCINDSVEQYHQAQHRILRGKSRTPKFAYLLSCVGTVEERQFDNIKRGEELLKTAEIGIESFELRSIL